MPVRRLTRTVGRALLVAVAALALSGCRLELTADAVVERDGSGRAALTVGLDAELVAALEELAVDPTAQLTAAVGRAPGWTSDRRSSADGGLEVVLARDVASVDELAQVFRELTAGLAPTDPALLVDLDLLVDDAGATELTGTVAMRPPAAPGVEDPTDGPTAAELAELTVRHTAARLHVTLPAPARQHDADRLEGRTLTWQVPVGEERTIAASAPAPPGPPRPVLVALVAGGVLLALVGTLVGLRRRGRAPGADPAPRRLGVSRGG